jgi:IS30 family transposase
MSFKLLTIEERLEIERLIKCEYSLAKISRILGRGKNTIVLEVTRNGGRDLYDGYKANNYFIERKNNKILNLRKALNTDGILNLLSINKKMSLMEMQIEILIEQIRELKK